MGRGSALRGRLPDAGGEQRRRRRALGTGQRGIPRQQLGGHLDGHLRGLGRGHGRLHDTILARPPGWHLHRADRRLVRRRGSRNHRHQRGRHALQHRPVRLLVNSKLHIRPHRILQRGDLGSGRHGQLGLRRNPDGDLPRRDHSSGDLVRRHLLRLRSRRRRAPRAGRRVHDHYLRPRLGRRRSRSRGLLQRRERLLNRAVRILQLRVMHLHRNRIPGLSSGHRHRH